jgi:predicted lipid-binding transport protein (Tim44 family)
VDSETRDGPPRALLIAAIVMAAGAIIAILTFAALRQSPPQQNAVAIASVPAPKADSVECRTLTDALPDQLGDYRRAPAAEPAPAGAAAWQATPQGEAVILRCGLDRPAEFVIGSPIQVVDAVQWFEVADHGRSTWFVVDRPVYVALTLPPGSGPTPIQEISEVIAKSLAAKPIDPASVG